MAIVSSSSGRKPPRRPEALVDPQPAPEEVVSRPEDKLRPQRLNDYIGQSELKQVLGIAVEAALGRGDALDHVLLYGPPGLGKTTMAMVLAEEMGVQCKVTSAPALERPRDIVGLLVNLQPRDLLFIDEIHRLSRVAEELALSGDGRPSPRSHRGQGQHSTNPFPRPCRPSPLWGPPPAPDR